MAVRRGIWVVVFLLGCAVLLSAALVAFSWVAFSRPPGVPDKGVLVLKIQGDLEEISTNPFDALVHEPVTVRSITEALRAAKTDPRVTGVLLKPIQAPALWGKVQELRDALVDFRSSGKPLVAFLEYAGDREYVLASAATRVVLVPPGQLNLTGLASYQVFLRGTFDMVGAQPDLLHIGDYKTAVNTFTEKGFTPAHREMTESLNHDAFEQLLGVVASARKKTVDEVRTLVDQGPMLPDAALGHGLVDDVAYFDEIGKTSGLGDRFSELPLEQYLTLMPAARPSLTAPKVAVLYAVGTIVSGSGGTGATGTEVGSDKLTEYIREVRNDDSIKAAVLRVDSPGGSTVASDVIWRELMLLRARKPLVVSMSDLAASGGYYIAMPGHVIVAQPGTLTGSIGIFSGKFVVGGTYNKLGMTIEAVSEGKYAEMYSGARPFTADERVKVEEQMQAFYDQFVEKVAESRGSTPEKIDAVAQGRVWTGRQAREKGLVDELGGLPRAIAIAQQRAGIAKDTTVQLVTYPPRPSVLEALSSTLGGGQSMRASLGEALLSPQDRETLASVRRPLQMLRRGEALALLPWVFVR
ncbi:signal peptide peptidase SppA [Luteitalea sp.]|uniref:signal peptide peptidase SppA n=1 Tax=Luteitalea sp. TaxID=2004800 RepID=UPI0037C97A46